jgi:hypothetical protein
MFRDKRVVKDCFETKRHLSHVHVHFYKVMCIISSSCIFYCALVAVDINAFLQIYKLIKSVTIIRWQTTRTYRWLV